MGWDAVKRLGVITALAILIADQISKYIVVQNLQTGEIIPVTSFFNLVLVWNPGISFGLFKQGTETAKWALVIIALIIIVALFVWLWRNKDGFVAGALGLVIGGAAGNVIDRLVYGAVVDFADVHTDFSQNIAQFLRSNVGTSHWPAFNVADAAITIGALMILWDALLRDTKSAKKKT